MNTCIRYPTLTVPRSIESAFTYAQQIAYLDDQIKQLKARVEALENPEA